jgi:hypothetical protein
MVYTQIITPNPNVACQPGYCLKYVQDAFGLSAIYPTAIAAWNASSSKHEDRNFPAGCWIAVWFRIATVPAGHVALLAPDGSVYSSSDPNTNVPHHHPSLDALIQYYAKANPLTYLGWTEDVEGTAVIKQGGIMNIPDSEYQDLIKWKQIGTDAEAWKQALEKSSLWPLISGDSTQITPVVDDLVAWKKKGVALDAEKVTTTSQPVATPLKPGLYEVK